MTDVSRNTPDLWRPLAYVLGAIALAGLYLTSLYSYLLFHCLVELFSIAVAWGLFFIAWNSRQFLKNNYLLFIGIAYVFVAGFDLLHTLAYEGMGVFPEYGADLAPQLWLTGRFLEASCLLVAPLFLRRNLHLVWVFVVLILFSALSLASMLYWRVLPICFVDGVGLTRFKVGTEYLICSMLLVSMGLLFKHREYFEDRILKLVIWSIAFTIGSELAFTFYVQMYDFSNLVGHYFKLFSFFLLYKAIIETGLRRPYDLLVRELAQEQEVLRQREKELLESRNRFRSLVEAAGGVILVLSRDHRILEFNRQAEALFGRTRDQVLGKDYLTLFVSAEMRPVVRDTIRKVVDGDSPASHENMIIDQHGTERVLLWNMTRLLAADSAVVGVIWVGQDITDRKRDEERLQESEERFRQLAEHIQKVFWLRRVIPPEGFLYVSPAFKDVWGRDPEQVIRDPRLLREAIHPEDRDMTRNAFKEFLEGEEEYNIEYRIVRPDGTVRWIRERAFAIRDGDGRIYRVAGLSQDVTRPRMDREAQDQLVEEIRHFAYIVSHDMRAPLVNLRGFSLEVRDGLEAIRPAIERGLPLLPKDKQLQISETLKEDLPEALYFIDSSISRMASLIEAIMKLARLGRTELQFELLDMNRLVQEALDTLAYQIEARGVKVIVGELPATVADRVAMEQIMGNLLTNAIKYLDPVRPAEVEISGCQYPEETVFLVRDTGRGIEEAHLDKVFQVFQRAGIRDVPGDGMGLAYVRTLVRRHGGRIWCESAPGIGSTFTFSISNRLVSLDQQGVRAHAGEAHMK